MLGVFLLVLVPVLAYKAGHYVAYHVLAMNLGDKPAGHETLMLAGTWFVIAELIDVLALGLVLFGKGAARLVAVTISVVFAFLIPGLL